MRCILTALMVVGLLSIIAIGVEENAVDVRSIVDQVQQQTLKTVARYSASVSEGKSVFESLIKAI
jgi:energy-converting hydrogenase Eha subunit G